LLLLVEHGFDAMPVGFEGPPDEDYVLLLLGRLQQLSVQCPRTVALQPIFSLNYQWKANQCCNGA
jgi:hypothetical protein